MRSKLRGNDTAPSAETTVQYGLSAKGPSSPPTSPPRSAVVAVQDGVEEPMPRRAMAAALGALGVLALSGCASGSDPERKSPARTGITSAALTSGLTAVASLVELRNQPTPVPAGPADPPVYVRGYASDGDGGEGFFWYDPGDTTSTDNDGTIVVDIYGQRWHRVTEGAMASVKWFGARGDGMTDDVAAIQTAINYMIAPSGGPATLWFPPGVYRISGTLYVYGAIAMVGAANHTIGQATRIQVDNLSYDAIDVIQVNHGFSIRGIDIASASTGGGGGCAVLLYQCQTVDIENIVISNMWSGILNDSSGNVYIRRAQIDLADVAPPGFPTYRFGVKCTAVSTFPGAGNPNLTECDAVVVNGNTANYPRTAHGFVLANGYNSLTLDDCGALHCDIGRWMTNSSASEPYHGPPDFLVDESGACDHCNVGWGIDDGQSGTNVQISNCICTSSERENYYVRNGFPGDVHFSGCRVVNSGGAGAAIGHGFALNGAGNHVLAGCTAWGTGGHCVFAGPGATVSISGGVFQSPNVQGNSPSRNVMVFQGCHAVSIAGAVLKGNPLHPGFLPAALIEARDLLRLSVTGNQLLANNGGAYGLSINNCNDVAVNGNVVTGGGGAAAIGIEVENSRYCAVGSNRVTLFYAGIWEGGTSDRNTFVANCLGFNTIPLTTVGANSIPAFWQPAGVGLNTI